MRPELGGSGAVPGAIAYLGPEGTFTHAATQAWRAAQSGPARQRTKPAASQLGGLPERPLDTAREVVEAVVRGADSDCAAVTFGVIPIENTIEGTVVPSLDALLAAPNVIAIAEVVLPITFDAFVRPEHGPLTEAVAHPHALAQASHFLTEHRLKPVAAASNAAACRDLAAHQVALGPADCGPRYGLTTLASGVQDYRGALTRFLVLSRREVAADLVAGPDREPAAHPIQPMQTMLAITPTQTGPGVLARIANAFGGLGVNMSSLVTRPLKARRGQYVFIVTFDAAPWEAGPKSVLAYLLASGDALKILAVYQPDPAHAAVDSVLPETVPPGSVTAATGSVEQAAALLWGSGRCGNGATCV